MEVTKEVTAVVNGRPVLRTRLYSPCAEVTQSSASSASPSPSRCQVSEGRTSDHLKTCKLTQTQTITNTYKHDITWPHMHNRIEMILGVNMCEHVYLTLFRNSCHTSRSCRMICQQCSVRFSPNNLQEAAACWRCLTPLLTPFNHTIPFSHFLSASNSSSALHMLWDLWVWRTGIPSTPASSTSSTSPTSSTCRLAGSNSTLFVIFV